MTIHEQITAARAAVAAHKALSTPAVTAAARAAYEPIKVEGTEQERLLAHLMFIAGMKLGVETAIAITKEQRREYAESNPPRLGNARETK